MADVARLARVSPMTVSRALQDASRVSPAARDKVLAAVDALGYRRNENARNLRLGRAGGLIGLVLANLANPFYSQLALGVESYLAEHGMRVLMGNSAGVVDRERQLVHDFASRRLDGLVVVPCGSDHRHLEPGLLAAMPLVLVAAPGLQVHVDEVLLDDFGGTKEMTRRLVAAGHERIAYLGYGGSMWTGSERFRGYTAALEEAGRTVDDRLVVRQEGDETTAAERITRELLAAADPPTALFAANNRNMVGAYRALLDHGGDVELAGFDDFEYADLLGRPVSLVRYDAHEMGRRAAALLRGRVSGERPPAAVQRVVLPTEIVAYGRRADRTRP